MSYWSDAVQQTGQWYAQNVNEYGQSKFVDCPLDNAGRVRCDCSGFVSACMRVAGLARQNECFRSGDFASENGPLAQRLKKAGFKPIKFETKLLRPFDIIAKEGHVEIFDSFNENGKPLVWAWGRNHNIENGGLPTAMSKQAYTLMWRLEEYASECPLIHVGDLEYSTFETV